jgi:hypothetical protein
VRSRFIAELKVSRITTLDQLNEAFLAWADLHYNRRVHSETAQAPILRWRQAIEKIRYADEESLRQAFLWKEKRTPDKAGVFSLFSVRYQVGSELARRRIEVRYDPEALRQVEIWYKGRFVERVRPFQVHRHRRPKADKDTATTAPASTVGDPPTTPTADWLGHLVERRRKERFLEPTAQQRTEGALAHRRKQDEAIIDLLRLSLHPAVVDPEASQAFLDRYGPFDPHEAEQTLERTLLIHPRDQHVLFYLEAIRDAAKGEENP